MVRGSPMTMEPPQILVVDGIAFPAKISPIIPYHPLDSQALRRCVKQLDGQQAATEVMRIFRREIGETMGYHGDTAVFLEILNLLKMMSYFQHGEIHYSGNQNGGSVFFAESFLQ